MKLALPIGRSVTQFIAIAIFVGSLICCSLPVRSQPPHNGHPKFVLRTGSVPSIEDLTFNTNGTILATRDSGGDTSLWDVRTGEILYTLAEKGIYSNDMAFSPDGKLLAVLTNNDKLELRDIATGRLIRVLHNNEEAHGSLVFSPDGKTLALGGGEASVHIWNWRTGKRMCSFRAHMEGVRLMAFSPDGAELVCANGDDFSSALLEIWRVSDGTLLDTLHTSRDVHSLAYSPDGRTIAIGIGDWPSIVKPTVELWDRQTKTVLKTLSGYEFEIINLAFSRDGSTLTSADAQGILKLWDVKTGTLRGSMGEKAFESHMSVSPDGRLGAETDDDGTVRVYDLTTTRVVATLPGNPHSPARIAFSPNGAEVITSGNVASSRRLGRGKQQEFDFWDTQTGNLTNILTVKGYGPSDNEGLITDHVVVTAHAHTITVWERDSRRVLSVFEDRTRDIAAAAVSPDGQTLAIGGAQVPPPDQASEGNHFRRQARVARLELLNLRTGELLRRFVGHTDIITAVAFLDRARILISVGADGTIRRWNVTTGKEIGRVSLLMPISEYPSWEETTVLSADGKYVAVETRLDPYRVRLFDTLTGKSVGALSMADQQNLHIALAPDGMKVAATGGDSTFRLWDRHTGKLIKRDTGTTSLVDLAFSPDGKTLASLDIRDRLRFWRSRDAKLIATRTLLGDRDWIAFTPDGHYEGSANVDAFVRWRMGDNEYPANRFHSQYFRPDRVQIALSGRPQRAQYGALLQKERKMRVQMSLEAAKIASQKERPLAPATPTEVLKQALTTMSMLDNGALEEQVAAKVKELLAAGADINTQGGWGTTPLMFLASHGDTEAVRSLINQNADLNIEDVYGDTALLDAARGEHTEIMQMLLNAGADIKDQNGQSLLPLRGDAGALGKSLAEVAVENPFIRQKKHRRGFPQGLCMALLYLGAAPDVKDTEGNTPLFKVGLLYPAVLRLLLEKGADPNQRDKTGYTFLTLGGRRISLETTRLLLDHGANVNLANKFGETPLHHAAYNSNTEVIKLLLERGADPNATTDSGSTPLMGAVSERHLEVVRLLLDHGAQVNIADRNDHWSALTRAVTQGDATMIKLLLEHGADAKIRTKYGKDLLAVLKDSDPNDQFGIAAILKRAGATK